MQNQNTLLDHVTRMPLTVRMRRSAFWERSHLAGAQAYIVYNNMLIATDFMGAEEDYHHLKSAVQIWDVGVERQIEISGPDALRLVQMSTPRDIGKMARDQCFYIPTVDSTGGMSNDPVLLKRDEERYWVSIADSDLILYYKGVAAALGLNVKIQEADVSPLAIQGPYAQTLVSRIWGEAASDLKFFRHITVEVDGRKMILARSGYSLQGGYELYFEGQSGAGELWDTLMDVGADLDVKVGSPCQAERIEGGLLSYLSDIAHDMTPFEAGLGKFCNMTQDVGCLAWEALRAKQSPTRQIRPVEIEGGPLPPQTTFWPLTSGSQAVGRVSSSCRAYDYDCNAAIGLIDAAHWSTGSALMVHTSAGPREAVVKDTFWGRSA